MVVKQKEEVKEDEEKDPTEAIAVLYDLSGSMGCRFFNDKEINRMGATNAFFSAFADKTMAYELNHIVQLLTFNTQTVIECDWNNNFEKFINLVDSSNPGGGTALYDCMDIAINSLLEVKKKYPDIILRIIALSDGEDLNSKLTAEMIAKRIVKERIIIDSFVAGNSCSGLKKITFASGGKCF